MPKDRVCGYYVTTARYTFDDVTSILREYPRESERQLLVGCWRSQKQNLHVQSLRWPSGSIQLIQNRQQVLHSYQEPLLLSWHRGGQQSRGRVHVSGCVPRPPSPGPYLRLGFSRHWCAVWNAAPLRATRPQVLERRIPAPRWLLLARWGPAGLWESGWREKNRRASRTRLRDFWPHFSWRAADANRHKFQGTHTGTHKKLKTAESYGSINAIANWYGKKNVKKGNCDLDTNHDLGG